ncbi:MAG: bifunctional 4-hydroxy-2-oxoglutarate aldolase/2-dehydro-3-deoxy-phosphogluconate aldolase [Erysipelotrichaceae bacterium]
MNNLLHEIANIGIVPVVKIDRVEDALPLAKALIEGGLPIAEITFRTACAAQAMEAIAKAYPEMIIGAGTVLTEEQVDTAIAAGAHFIVSPGLNPSIVKYCMDKDILIIPGVANASDIESALSLGLKNVKFFPAEPLGGIKMIKALAAPYGDVKFMPTGGISAANLGDYLRFEKILCCGGSWMVDASLVAAGRFDEIKRLTQEAVAGMLNLRLLHVGVNDANSVDAFASLLNQDATEHSKSWFVGKTIEIMKENGRGTNGHIAYATSDIKRAQAHFERRGYTFAPESAAYDAKGNVKAIYFTDDIGGFAIHLVQQ